jgi:hypothetical protein
MTYFKEKNFHLSEGPHFFTQELKKLETPQNEEKYLF